MFLGKVNPSQSPPALRPEVKSTEVFCFQGARFDAPTEPSLRLEGHWEGKEKAAYLMLSKEV